MTDLKRAFKLATYSALLFPVLMLLFLLSCKEKKAHEADVSEKLMYTCPMPEDSVFSDKPGTCPKCGMQLIKKEIHNHHESDHLQAKAKIFTCPMHPDIIRDEPGLCPICGMSLVEKPENGDQGQTSDPGILTEPVNHTVLASVTTIKPEQKSVSVVVEAFGYISYNPKNTHSIASKVSGRIDKLYVKYNFQPVKKGDRIMDIYSPELVTAQEDLIFLLNTNADDTGLIKAGMEKLKLLGMNKSQITRLVETKKPTYLITVYSNVDGHLHQMGSHLPDITSFIVKSGGRNMDRDEISEDFSIKEGMYIERGQTVFNVIGTEKMWAILKIFPQDLPYVKIGQEVEISPEMLPNDTIKDRIDFIEPVFIKGSRYLSARVYLEGSDHQHHKFKIGSFVRANIQAGKVSGLWIPKQAAIDLGNAEFAVFVKDDNVFRSKKIRAGAVFGNMVEVKEGLSSAEVIASDARYLIDSEGFVKTD